MHITQSCLDQNSYLLKSWPFADGGSKEDVHNSKKEANRQE